MTNTDVDVDKFYKLVDDFLKAGYNFDIKDQGDRYFALYYSCKYRISVGFCTPNPSTYQELSGNVCVKLYGVGWSDSRIILPFPKSTSQFNYLLRCIREFKCRSISNDLRGYRVYEYLTVEEKYGLQ